MMSTHAEGMATADDARSRDNTSNSNSNDQNNNNSNNNNSSSNLTTTLSTTNTSQDLHKKKSSDNSNQLSVEKTVVKKNDQDKSNLTKGQLIANEDRMVGSVSMKVYTSWAIAAGGIYSGVIILLSFAFGECKLQSKLLFVIIIFNILYIFFSFLAISVLSSFWLSYWSAHR